MGRININFNVHIAGIFKPIPNYGAPERTCNTVPAKDLAMILMNLPGFTHITGCVTGQTDQSNSYFINTVEAVNDAFPDGTEINVRYRQETVDINGSRQQYELYDGFVINYPQPFPYTPKVTAIEVDPCIFGHDWEEVPGLDIIDPAYEGIYKSHRICKKCDVTE